MNETTYNSQWTGGQIDEAIGDVRENKAKWNSSDVFYATYGETTFAEVKAAIETGKAVFVNIAEDDAVVPLTFISVGQYLFTMFWGVITYTATLDVSNAWYLTKTKMAKDADLDAVETKADKAQTTANNAATAAANAQSTADSKVPKTRTVNGKALDADISLSASDVGARANTWMPSASEVGAPTVAEMNAAIAAIPTPDVSGQINTHNSNTSAHSDIRQAVSAAASAAANAQSAADSKATMAQVNAAIAAIPTPDVSGQISAHNSSSTAHGDIRTIANNAASAASAAQSAVNSKSSVIIREW